MARNDIPNGWDKIRQNVQETERLMGQKQYNQSMIKANHGKLYGFYDPRALQQRLDLKVHR